MRRGSSAALAFEPLVRPLAVPDSAASLLATVQPLYLEMQFASPAARPFLEREIRGYADRYRACGVED
jgi:hypothetical protein